jgi:hypothetical protein
MPSMIAVEEKIVRIRIRNKTRKNKKAVPIIIELLSPAL